MYSDEEDYGYGPMGAAPEEDLSIDSPPPSDEGDFAEDAYGQHGDTYSDNLSNTSYKRTISEEISDVEDSHYPPPTFKQDYIQPTDRFHAVQVALDDAERNVRPTKVEERMDKLDDKLDSGYDYVTKVQANFESIAQPIQAAVNASPPGRRLEATMDDFAHSIPAFIDVLEDIGKIHPYLNAVISAFTIVYTNEKARRNVDKNIAIVFVEMKEMLMVLRRLDGVDKDGLAEEDKERLQELSDLSAEDIKTCGNMCDAYSKKSFASKLLKSRHWLRRFTDVIDNFKDRRMRFESILSLISTTLMIQVNKQVMDSGRKMDEMLELLHTPLPPDSRKSRKALMECKSDKDYEVFLKKNRPLYMSELEMKSMKGDGELEKKKLKETIEELKQSNDDIARDEEKNMKKFRILFDLQKQNIESIVKHESDRAIGELTKTIEGPVNKIRDKDIYAVWLDGGWKGSVKARHFILALRDYFHDQAEKDKTLGEEQHTQTLLTDRWAFQYIDIPYLQPILEAIDDDASGFIRISEVNTFTGSKPADWSLPKWIAFWAVGWHAFVQKEISKMHAIFGEMFSSLQDIRHENQLSAEAYLMNVWKTVLELAGPPGSQDNRSEYIIDRFASYMELEEIRLKKMLEMINYDIDDVGTVEIIVGPGRVEKNIFLLLRLLLERHLKVFELGKELPLHPYELIDAAESVFCILEAVNNRYLDLKVLFADQRLDAKLQFKTFEYGIFQYINDPSSLWPNGLSVCERAATTTYSDSDSESESESRLESKSDLKSGDTNNNSNKKAAIAVNALANEILIHKLDETEYETLSFHYMFYCDCCGEGIDNNRIICLDCVSSDGIWNTVDFCTTNANCSQRQIIHRSDLLKEHNPQHNLILLRQIPHVYLVLLAFYLEGDSSIYQRALDTIKRTQDRGFSDSAGQGVEEASCAACKESIVLPCWTCIFCPDDDDDDDDDDEVEKLNDDSEEAVGRTPSERYICSSCISSTADFDDRYHMFVRCPPKEEDAVDMSLESRLSRVEAMLETLLKLHNIQEPQGFGFPQDLE